MDVSINLKNTKYWVLQFQKLVTYFTFLKKTFCMKKSKLFILTLSTIVAFNIHAQVKVKPTSKQPSFKGCQTIDPVNSFAFDTSKPSRGLADNNFLWDNGKTLNVKLMSGSKKLKDKVKKYASEWEKYGNLKFNFIEEGDAQIRVYLGDGSKGHGHVTMGLGIRCLMRDENEFTMHFDTTALTVEQQLKGTVLHEFGHALGLMHEHMSPVSGIKWKKEMVYGRMKATQGWDKDMTDAQLFRKYNISYTNGTKYDPKSIMHYPITRWDTEDGYEVKWNYELSEGDKALIQALYPKNNRTNEVARVAISNPGKTIVETSTTKDGVSVYPSFKISCAGKEANLYYVSFILDENNQFVSTNSKNFNINNRAGNIKTVKIPAGTALSINKEKKDFEIFFPKEELPTSLTGQKIKVWFRIFLVQDDEVKELITFMPSSTIVVK